MENYIRYVDFENKELADMLDEYKSLSKIVLEYTEQIGELEKERNKTAIKGQKLKDKMNPIAQGFIQEHLGEFDWVSDIEKEPESDVVKFKIVDRVEQFKEGIRKIKAEQKAQEEQEEKEPENETTEKSE